ncbi:MAG: serine hydrolase [Spirochaetales bacterium]|jgi:CubicO group peptidase (beta-lactamase class C family)|nr:serine hydrolase [Spirochaetales bacterium]
MNLNFEEAISRTAEETSFCGVVDVCSEERSFRKVWGFRDRANRIKNIADTRFGIASGTKGFTALGIASLIEEGKFARETKASSLLGDRFPDLHPSITIEQLLAHTSGVGDHYDEDEIKEGVDDFVLSIPVQNLESPFDYLPLLRERTQKFIPGRKACYSNGGYVVLAMIIELVGRVPFHRYIEDRIFHRAGMTRSGFFRSDNLPENTAMGYLVGKEKFKTNVFNLPVIGSGDGGAYSSLEDMKLFWQSLLSFKIVGKATLEPMVKAQNRFENRDYGLGFWIENEGNFIALEGYDAGVSFYSAASRDLGKVFTVISNDRSGAWPILKTIKKELFQQGRVLNVANAP